MSKPDYEWKRFWCPRTAQINLSNRGYLVDPDSERGKHCNPELVSFEAISDVPCLVLLGEPGTGKSKAIETEQRNFSNLLETEGKDYLILDLHSYGSEDRLVKDLFESSQVKSWLESDCPLHIFLDSLDECLLRMDNVTAVLATGFKKYQDKIDRLFLRIVCRTAVWQTTFEEQLRQIWGKDKVKIYELVQLRWVDVRHAAERGGIEKLDTFMQEILDKNLVPLAIKPVTLGFLLNIYRRSGQFSENQSLCDIYLEGCRILCDEDEEDPRRPGHKENLELEQRLIVAARIAAVTVFAHRDAIWIGRDRGQIPEEDVPRSELVQGYERANARQFEASEAAITEVLYTGLFSSRGPSRRGWAHQTYSEFLAAWYLKQHSLKLNQVLSVIIHPDGRIVPQLQETVAWLASMRPDVFQAVMKTDPDVLLQSDISTVDDENKAKLVEALLRLCNEEKLQNPQFWRYPDLNHPGLPQQLESYICDSSKNQCSRLVAIDIARDCDVKAVQKSLSDIALDPAQPYLVRTQAALTICTIGDEKTKVQLKPLALGEAGEDPNDDLKGYGLEATWPQHITVEDVLSHFSQPQQREVVPVFGGVYQNFIATEFAKHIQLSDLPIALKWLEQFPDRHDLHYPFRELADSVMLKAWQNLDKPDVLEAFANIAILRLKQHDGILSDCPSRSYTRDSLDDPRDSDIESFLKDSDEKRRQLTEKIISLLSESESELPWLIYIICSEDILWMIECAVSMEPHRIASIWVKLLHQALTFHNMDWKYTKHVDAILEASKVSSAMRLEFEFDITSIDLGSEKAEQEKAKYLRYQVKPPVLAPILDPPPKQKLLAILERVEAGQPELWPQVCMEMTLTSTSICHSHHDGFELDITKLFGWEEAEADTKARIVKAAKNYLDGGSLETQPWLRTDKSPFAGCQALYLLAKQEPEFISTLSRGIWKKWIPGILKSMNFPYKNGENKDEFYRKVMKAAYQGAPDEFIEFLITLMIQNKYRPCYRLTSELLDQCLANSILSKIPDEELNADMLEVLLTDIFKYEIDRAREISVSLIATSVPESGKARNKAIVAARLIAAYAENSSWLVLWSAIQKDREFGRTVFESIALQAAREGQIEKEIKEQDLANLYIFLAREYPEVEQLEPDTRELRGIEARILEISNVVRIWKNYIPQRIQARGTQEACDALRQIIRELPEQRENLQPMLLEAESLARRKTWKPPKLKEVLQIVLDQDKRLVQDGHQLLNVLIESLQRLELELQGETPASRDLWDKNTGRNNPFRPIDENAFSDYVKRFLDRDLKSRAIIVNREVELRRGSGGNPGERTDIHVDAVLKQPNGEIYDSVTVIIEVKGCWNPAVKTAMESQLVGRYLKDTSNKYGLYLIGWFSCQQWDGKDSRNNKTPQISLDEARKQFDDQAATLSSSGNVVRAYVLNTALR